MRRSPDDPTLGGSLRPRGPIQFALTTRYDGRVTVIGVAGEVDILTVSKLATRLDDAVRRRQGDMVIDLSDAEFIDSMGLHALLRVHRRLVRQARTLTVICPPGAVRNAIELARLAEPLGLVSSIEDYRLRGTDPDPRSTTGPDHRATGPDHRATGPDHRAAAPDPAGL